MSESCGDFLITRLHDWGVRRIYGCPGEDVNGIMGALVRSEKTGARIEFIQAPHEEMAAFMACGHAKLTGEVGVCVAASGPAAIRCLNGLYDAKMDHAPVVAIVGQASRQAMGGSCQQEVDLLFPFKDVAGDYVHQAAHPAQIRPLIDRAMRLAKAERTVSCLILPSDLQEMPAIQQPAHEHGAIHRGLGHVTPRVIPSDADLRRAAAVLNEGERVAILVGADAMRAADEVIEAAEILGAGVAKALSGKAVLPDDLPYVTGTIGWPEANPSREMMARCDTLLMIGASFPHPEFPPKEERARCVQIDLDQRRLSLSYPAEVCLAGDSRDTLRYLLPRLERKKDRSWRESIEIQVTQWWKMMESRALNSANLLHPPRVFWELSRRLPEQCVLCADSGPTAGWCARDLKIRAGMKASLPGNAAATSTSIPYAIAAKFAYPNRVVIALAGEGAMRMNGINGLITVAKYWRQWKDPRWIALVLNHRDPSTFAGGQGAAKGAPKDEAWPDLPYADYAEMLGLKGLVLDDPEEVGGAWNEALEADRPVVIDARTAPEGPPPRVTVTTGRQILSAPVEDEWLTAHLP